MKSCRAEFEPRSISHKACGSVCAELLAVAQRQRAERKQEQEDRAATKKALEKFKRKPTWLLEAQKVFNAYRREVCRIAGHRCISCGLPLDWSGNQVDAGHYRSVGSAAHLRFVEQNVWAQCKHCNKHLAGNHVSYRIGLIARIGQAAVEALEADQTERKYSIPELREIITTYRRKLKELQKEAA
ncbi:recombination protein NinG [Massilia agilis]